MESPSTSSVYIQVIENVINKVREEFIRIGGEEDDLNNLQRAWELKLRNAGAIVGPIDRPAVNLTAPGDLENTLHDLNVPYGGPQEYDTPTADLPFPLDVHNLSSGKRKRDDLPSQHRPGGYIPQQDGAGDVIANESEAGEGSNSEVVAKVELSAKIPQVDPEDTHSHSTSNTYTYQGKGAVNEDHNVANTSAPPEVQEPDPDDDDEDEPLNENDDDDVANVDIDDEQNTRQLVVFMF